MQLSLPQLLNLCVHQLLPLLSLSGVEMEVMARMDMVVVAEMEEMETEEMETEEMGETEMVEKAVMEGMEGTEGTILPLHLRHQAQKPPDPLELALEIPAPNAHPELAMPVLHLEAMDGTNPPCLPVTGRQMGEKCTHCYNLQHLPRFGRVIWTLCTWTNFGFCFSMLLNVDWSSCV